MFTRWEHRGRRGGGDGGFRSTGTVTNQTMRMDNDDSNPRLVQELRQTSLRSRSPRTGHCQGHWQGKCWVGNSPKTVWWLRKVSAKTQESCATWIYFTGYTIRTSTCYQPISFCCFTSGAFWRASCVAITDKMALLLDSYEKSGCAKDVQNRPEFLHRKWIRQE